MRMRKKEILSNFSTLTDSLTFATNSLVNGDSLLQYMDSSIQPKEENWFLRMCHYISMKV